MSQNDMVAVPLPGFKGEWERRNLGAVLKVKHGKSQRTVEAINGPYPILASGGVIGRSSEALYSKPSVLIGRKGTIDKPRFMDTPFWTVDTLFYTEINPDCDPKFLYYKFCMVDWYRYNEASGVPSLNASVIERIEILVPAIAEQQAIARVLTDVDALIEALDKLIAKKRAMTQGAVQQLWRDCLRWEEVAVSSVLKAHFSGPSPTCEERNIRGNEWGVLRTTCSTWEGGWNWKNHKLLPQIYWGQEKRMVHDGDTIITKAGPRHRVGVPSYVDYVASRILPSGKMLALRPNPSAINPKFLTLSLREFSTQVYLNERTTGMAESQVNFENQALLNAPIRVPSLDEQLRIVETVDDLDSEIKALVARREKTALIKTGMMQELLTGRTRLV